MDIKCLNIGLIDLRYVACIKAWISQGKRYPGTYVNVIFEVESGLSSKSKHYPLLDIL